MAEHEEYELNCHIASCKDYIEWWQTRIALIKVGMSERAEENEKVLQDLLKQRK
jgi:hypothetical protein